MQPIRAWLTSTLPSVSSEHGYIIDRVKIRFAFPHFFDFTYVYGCSYIYKFVVQLNLVYLLDFPCKTRRF